MTFAQILTDTYRRTGYSASPVAEVVARVKASVNETQELIHSNASLRALSYGVTTLTTVASLARYGRTQTAQVRSLVDASRQITLQPRSLAWYRAHNPDPDNNTGIPEWYIPLGYTPLLRLPATTGTGLWAESTSASDTTQTVAIDGIRVGGGLHTPSATTLTGLTRVAIGGGSALTDYINVMQFAISAVTVGDIVLYDAAVDGNALASIRRGYTTSRYWSFLLCPTPSEVIDYTVDVEHEIFPLVNDTDEPIMPPRFHRILAMGARMIEYEKTSDSRYAVAKQQFDDGMNDLIYQVTCPPGFTVVPGGGTRDAFGSNLGPYFPSGRW